jgi:hypothetical protein
VGDHRAAEAGRLAVRQDGPKPWGAAAHGVLGTGTGRLSATAISGNIALLRRPVDPA